MGSVLNMHAKKVMQLAKKVMQLVQVRENSC
jgi:hypothetical protein